MNINAGTAGIKCEWQVDLINAKSGLVVKHIPWHKNMILNAGMDDMIKMAARSTTGVFYIWSGAPNYAPTYNCIAVGTGTAAPAFTDVALGSWLAAKTVNWAMTTKTVAPTNNTTPLSFILKATFGETEANGTISEMGISKAATNGSGLFCKNLLVDGSGNPTTIVKDNAHLLEISARITFTRVGDPFASVPITEVGGLGTANNVISFVNNQWIIQAMHYGSNGSFDGDPAYAMNSSCSLYASPNALDITNGIANKTDANMTSVVNYSLLGTNLTKVAVGKTGDDYYIDLKVEIPQAACNVNIKTLFIKNFFRGTGDTATYGVNGCMNIFETPLPKDNTKKIYLAFRHTWTRA